MTSVAENWQRQGGQMTDSLPTSLEDGEQPKERDRGRDIRLVATGIVLGLLVWFALINLQDVRVHFWVTSATAPVVVVIAVAGALGAGVSLLVSRLSRRGK